MSLPGGIEAFAVAALEGLGGAVEPDGAALYTVLRPTARSADVEARRLAFDPEALEDAPDAELVIFGSPALDELVGLATASGRVARAFLATAANPSRAIADRLARAYRFRDAEWAPGEGRTWWLSVYIVAAVDDGVIRAAMRLGWADFEDAVTAAAAASAGCNALVTRNTRDFKGSPLPVIDTVTAVALVLSESA